MTKNKIKKQEIDTKLVYIFGLATPLFMIPQAVAIFFNKNAANISLVMWSFFLLADVVWIIYGVHHKIRPLVYSHALYFIVESVIIAGIVLYSCRAYLTCSCVPGQCRQSCTSCNSIASSYWAYS